MKYVYLRFSSFVWFLQFLSHFLWVLEARSKLTQYYTKFWVNRARFFASTCTSLLLRSKPVQWNYRHLFWRFRTKERVLRVTKSKITGENTFNEDLFEIEDNHESSKDEKIDFSYFYRFVTRALTLRPRNTYIYVFRALFGFCNF